MSEPWSSKVRISSYHLILSSWEVQDLNSSKCNPKNHHSVILDYNMEVYVFHQYFTGEIFSPVNSPVNRWCGEFFQFPILPGAPIACYALLTTLRRARERRFEYFMSSSHSKSDTERTSIETPPRRQPFCAKPFSEDEISARRSWQRREGVAWQP